MLSWELVVRTSFTLGGPLPHRPHTTALSPYVSPFPLSPARATHTTSAPPAPLTHTFFDDDNNN